MRLNCQICGDGGHHWSECPKLATRKTVPTSLLLELKKELDRMRRMDKLSPLADTLDLQKIGIKIIEGHTEGEIDRGWKHVEWELKIHVRV